MNIQELECARMELVRRELWALDAQIGPGVPAGQICILAVRAVTQISKIVELREDEIKKEMEEHYAVHE